MRQALDLTAFSGAGTGGMGAIVMKPTLGAPPGLGGGAGGMSPSLGAFFTPEQREQISAQMQQSYAAQPAAFWMGGVQAGVAGAFWGGVTGLVVASSWKGAGRGAMFLGGVAGASAGAAYLFGKVTVPGIVFLTAGLGMAGYAGMKAWKKR